MVRVQQGLAGSRGTDHDNIALFNLDALVGQWLLKTLIMIIDGHGEEPLGLILTDDVFVEMLLDFAGFGYFFQFERLITLQVLIAIEKSG